MARRTPTVHTSLLLNHCDPYEGCWPELDRPLTLRDVQRHLDRGVGELEPPFELRWTELPSQRELRQKHARKVAWFVQNGFQKPLHIDVGVPSLGFYPAWLVTDGNHRLAAAVFRHREYGEDPLLPVSVCGSVDRAKVLGLPI